MSDTLTLADLRPEVAAFALLMEAKLRKHDDRPGWKGDDPLALMRRLREEAEELARAVMVHDVAGFICDPQEETARDVGNEAADVANFAMMIADVCGGLR